MFASNCRRVSSRCSLLLICRKVLLANCTQFDATLEAAPKYSSRRPLPKRPNKLGMWSVCVCWFQIFWDLPCFLTIYQRCVQIISLRCFFDSQLVATLRWSTQLQLREWPAGAEVRGFLEEFQAELTLRMFEAASELLLMLQKSTVHHLQRGYFVITRGFKLVG